MIYTELTRRAMRVAYAAHDGQTDRAGVPYIFHPIHLAEQMTDEVSTCVALLHDVAEDTGVTLEELETQFPESVMHGVRLMTHDPAVDYFDYVRALKDDPVARTVKLADIAHNSDESRVEGCPGAMTEEERLALRTKYARARRIIEET